MKEKTMLALAVVGPIAVAASLWAAAWVGRENARQETEQLRACVSGGGEWRLNEGQHRICVRSSKTEAHK